MPVKRLSADDKRTKLSALIISSRTIHQLRDLERAGAKSCGITSMAIKEVLQSLVDDRLVHCEKVGTSNYYWSFPSEAGQIRKVQLEKLEMEQEKVSRTIQICEVEIEKYSHSIVDTEERKELLQEYSVLQSKSNEFKEELLKYADLDPETLKLKKKEIEVAREAINRWTDNIYSLQSHCINNFGMSRSDFNSQFGISGDFDYVN